MSDISALNGKTICNVTGLRKGSKIVVFTCADGSVFEMQHHQDCCEDVWLEDLDGCAQDIIGGYVVDAYESTKCARDNKYDENGTWTFYTINTDRGSVWLRWLGVSNGYYSESVSFDQVA